MRGLEFLFLVVLLSCSRSYSGLTIPTQQTFVLGEFMDAAYRVSLTNRGDVSVRVQLIDQSAGTRGQPLTLPPGQDRTLSVPAHQWVEIINATDRDAELWVEMNMGVDGMRLKTTEPAAPAPAPAENGPRARHYRQEVAPGDCYVLGEGAWMIYTARVSVAGEMVQLRVLDHKLEKQIMAFGLGAGNTETVELGLGDVLYLCNHSDRPLRLRVRLSKAVPAGRLEPTAR